MRISSLALPGGLLVVCLAFFGFQTTGSDVPSVDDGEQIYTTRCMSCHQADGNGIQGVFPPLNESEWVTGDKGRLIRIILHGAIGEYDVNGVVYSGTMPPWKTFLNDEEIAALSSYIRSSWNNDASAVTAEEVAAVRAATADRTTSWTQEELLDEANTGIPGQQAFQNLFGGEKADSTKN